MEKAPHDRFIDLVLEIQAYRARVITNLANLLEVGRLDDVREYYTDESLRRFLTEDEQEYLRRLVPPKIKKDGTVLN